MRWLRVNAKGEEKRCQRVGREAPVLEDRENAEVVNDGNEQESVALRGPLRAPEHATDEEVERAADEEDPQAQERPPRGRHGHWLVACGLPGAAKVKSVACAPAQ